MLVLLQMLGMALFVLGVQGGVRLAFDSDDGGALAWVPGGWPVQLAVNVVLVVAGAAVARYAQEQRTANAARERRR
jgi:hypothetical protein